MLCVCVLSVCHSTSRYRLNAQYSDWFQYCTGLLFVFEKLTWCSLGPFNPSTGSQIKWWSYPTTAASWCSSCGPWGRRATSVTAPSWWETALTEHINWCWLPPACSSGSVSSWELMCGETKLKGALMKAVLIYFWYNKQQKSLSKYSFDIKISFLGSQLYSQSRQVKVKFQII